MVVIALDTDQQDRQQAGTAGGCQSGNVQQRSSRGRVAHVNSPLRRLMADERYREQLGSFVDLSTAQVALSEASASEVTVLYDLKIREAELRRAAGLR